MSEVETQLVSNDEGFKTPYPMTLKVFYNNRGADIQVFRDGDEQPLGMLAVELYGQQLRAYSWTEDSIGSDPEVTVLKQFSEEET